MSFPAYPAYKYSSVEWLGDIPSHWNIKKFRYVFEESPEKITDEVVGDMLSVSGYRGIEVKQYDDEGRRRTDEELFGYRVVRPGQLVVNTMWLNYAGLGVSEHEGHVSPAYRSYWIDPAMDKRFIHHLMRSGAYVQGYTRLLTGIRPNSLQMGRDDLMVFPVLLPTKSEQTQIARFLDHETARIDALIEEQQRLIELLKEKRQAVISHAVTKGLDPTVPMKDSGVEWLGEVPAHWQVCKLSFRYSVELGKMLDEKRNTGANPVPYLRNQDVQWGAVNIDELPLMDIEPAEYGRYTVRLGDLLVCEGGDVGRAAIWRHIDSIIGYQKALHRLRPESPKSDTAEFFFYTLMAAKSLGVFEESDTKATISHLPAEKFRQYRFAFPPLEEQQKIAAVMGEILERSNETISYAERTITLLQERRSALISAAVTGKIDVRGWQPPTSTKAPELAVAEAV